MAALDLFGRRGTLRILWEMRSLEPFTFRSLASVTRLPPGTLNQRLKELREACLVSESAYLLTDLARDLLVVLEPLIGWSDAWAESLATVGPSQ